MTEPVKPRALTYTEMMNGGRQQLNEAGQRRERELQERVEALELQVDHLQQSLQHQPASLCLTPEEGVRPMSGQS